MLLPKEPKPSQRMPNGKAKELPALDKGYMIPLPFQLSLVIALSLRQSTALLQEATPLAALVGSNQFSHFLCSCPSRSRTESLALHGVLLGEMLERPARLPSESSFPAVPKGDGKAVAKAWASLPNVELIGLYLGYSLLNCYLCGYSQRKAKGYDHLHYAPMNKSMSGSLMVQSLGFPKGRNGAESLMLKSRLSRPFPCLWLSHWSLGFTALSGQGLYNSTRIMRARVAGLHSALKCISKFACANSAIITGGVYDIFSCEG